MIQSRPSQSAVRGNTVVFRQQAAEFLVLWVAGWSDVEYQGSAQIKQKSKHLRSILQRVDWTVSK